jgi:hypothetical protein
VLITDSSGTKKPAYQHPAHFYLVVTAICSSSTFDSFFINIRYNSPKSNQNPTHPLNPKPIKTMADPNNNSTATLPCVSTQLSQQPDEDDDDHNVNPSVEEPNATFTELPTAADIEPNANATNTDLSNAADIAFDLIVQENPHIHPLQHSQMMITVMVLLQSTSECCEKIGKLLFKCKRAKAKSIELTKIANSVIQQIRRQPRPCYTHRHATLLPR